MSARAGALRTGTPLTYVYHGKLYELRARASSSSRHSRWTPRDTRAWSPHQFATKNLTDGEQTRFALSYAIDGRLAEVPLAVSYQPRWWMQVDLALADDVDSPLDGSRWNGESHFLCGRLFAPVRVACDRRCQPVRFRLGCTARSPDAEAGTTWTCKSEGTPLRPIPLIHRWRSHSGLHFEARAAAS